MESVKLRTTTRIIKALADETRVRVICLLKNKKALCVCEITEIIGLAQPTISSHLRLLENAGLISSSKDGLWVNYNIRRDLDAFSGKIIDNLLKELRDDRQINLDMSRIKNINREEICRKRD